MIGEGRVFVDKGTKTINASEALEQLRLPPLRLEMKEGLALNNGIQFSTAIGVLAFFLMKDFVESAALITAISAQVMLGADTPFRSDLQELRPHRGAQVVASWIWNWMRNSPLRSIHASYDVDGEIRDPYNIRCAAQIIGTCYDLVEEAGATLEIEANSVTDNPLVLQDDEGAFTRIVGAIS
jgi:histidine ammonia-lyase